MSFSNTYREELRVARRLKPPLPRRLHRLRWATSQKNRPFQLKNKRSAGGNSLDNSRDGFSGGAQRGLARAGAGAESQPFRSK